MKNILFLFLGLVFLISCSLSPKSESEFNDKLYDNAKSELESKYSKMEEIVFGKSYSILLSSQKSYCYKVTKKSKYLITYSANSYYYTIDYSDTDIYYDSISSSYNNSGYMTIYGNNTVSPIGYIVFTPKSVYNNIYLTFNISIQ